MYRSRSNINFHREDVQKVFAKLIPHVRVNHRDPDYMIIVEVIKTICAVSVVPYEEYTRFRKYNVSLFAETILGEDGVVGNVENDCESPEEIK